MSDDPSMEEFLHALARNDVDLALKYAAAVVLALLLVWILCCWCFCVCHAMCYAFENTCCLWTWIFRLLRRVLCCGWWGGVRVHCIDDCKTTLSPSSFNNCTKKRIVARNAAGLLVDVPYCAGHWNTMKRRVAVELFEFERKGTRYTPNLRWSADTVDVRVALTEEIRMARTRSGSKPGIIYMCTSKSDRTMVPFGSGGGGAQPYMFRISGTPSGIKTEQMEEAVRQWDVATNVFVAEALIHTLLINERFGRVNTKTGQVEIDWFYVSQERAVAAILAVIEAGIDYRKLFNECERPE